MSSYADYLKKIETAHIGNLLGTGYTPYQAPSSPPVGTYDPALDAQLENANQGFAYAAQDYTLGGARNGEDLATQLGQLGQAHGNTLADLLTANQRYGADNAQQQGYLNADYGTQSGRLSQDYGTQTADLARNYQNLGNQENGAIRAAGAGEGGAADASLMARQANQGRDQFGLNTDYQRNTQDLSSTHDRGIAQLLSDLGRTNTDYATNVNRENQGYDFNTGQANQAYQRAQDDALTQYQRQGVTNSQFGQQINAQKVYDAQQAGTLPEGPSNEYTRNGQTFRTEVHNGTVYHRHPDGQLVAIRKVRP